MTSAQQSPLSRSSWKRCHIGAKRQSPKSIQARCKPCGAPSPTKAIGQGMPAVSFNGEVIEHMNSLRYLGINSDRMLTYQMQVESTKLRCKKGLSALKAMASKGVEQRHLFLLYQSVILSVTDYGLGLTTLSQANLSKLYRVQNEAMRVILGTTDTPIVTMRYLLDLRSMDTKRTVDQVKACLSAMHNLKNALHDAVKEQQER